MSKKTQKRQSAVISLSDRNAERVKEIQVKKEEVIQKYDEEKSGIFFVIIACDVLSRNIDVEIFIWDVL